jgi:Domain of unknown function (DUF4214)
MGLAAHLDRELLAELLECDGHAFVRRAYWVVLGREPDGRGLANYLDRLGSGTSKLDVLSELTGSPEGRMKMGGVQGPLTPEPTQVPTVPRTIVTRAAQSCDQLLALNGRVFIDCAYQTLLGREPDPEGQSFYIGHLRGGAPKIQILAQIRHSVECKTRLRRVRSDSDGESLDRLLRRLDWEIAKFWIARVPLLGRVLNATLGVEGSSPIEVRLRRIEFALLASRDEEDIPAELSEKDASPAESVEVSKSATRSIPNNGARVSLATTIAAPVSLRSLPAPWGKGKAHG